MKKEVGQLISKNAMLVVDRGEQKRQTDYVLIDSSKVPKILGTRTTTETVVI